MLCKEIISFDKLSIFFWASSIFVNLSKILLNVLFVFSKFWSSLSFTLSLIWFILLSKLFINFSKSNAKSLLNEILKSLTSFTTFVSNFPNLSVILDSLIFFVNEKILMINIIINKDIIIYKIGVGKDEE